MKAVNRAVTALRAANINNQRSHKVVEMIDPRYILIHAWSNGRLEESKRLLEEGFQHEDSDIPIVHAAYIPGLVPYYIMSGGEAHDVVAARLLGKDQIRVNISDVCNVEVNRLSIENNDVYFWAEEYEQWRRLNTESNETIQILQELGVQSKQSIGNRLKKALFSSAQ